jgi:hypothetical protein
VMEWTHGKKAVTRIRIFSNLLKNSNKVPKTKRIWSALISRICHPYIKKYNWKEFINQVKYLKRSNLGNNTGY